MGRISVGACEIEQIPCFDFEVCLFGENHKFHVSWGKKKVTQKIR